MKKLLILIMLLVIILAHLNARESSPRAYLSETAEIYAKRANDLFLADLYDHRGTEE